MGLASYLSPGGRGFIRTRGRLRVCSRDGADHAWLLPGSYDGREQADMLK